MIFPLWKFWTYSLHGFIAAIIWNTSEICGVRCPFAPTLFGWIIGAPKRQQVERITKLRVNSSDKT